MASPIAQLLMNKVMQDQQKKEQLENEKRQVLYNAAQTAVKGGSLDVLSSLLPQLGEAGIDPTLFTQQIQKPTSMSPYVQGTQRLLSGESRESVIQSTKQANQLPPAAISDERGVLPNRENAADPRVMQEIFNTFDPKFISQVVTKSATDIDPGYHTQKDIENWWKTFESIKQNNPGLTNSQIADETRAATGWMHEGATHLKDLAPELRYDLFNQKMNEELQDPLTDQFVKSIFQKNGWEHTKTAKIGFIANYLGKLGFSVSPKFQPFVDRFMGYQDDIQKFENQALVSKTLAEGRAKEQLAEENFTGVLGREKATTEMKREINKPYLDESALGSITAGLTFSKNAQNMNKLIEGFVRDPKTGTVDINRLPVGPVGEPLRKRMDKYGINADESRIRLRTQVLKLTELMYQIRGKQLSDMEIKLAQELMNSMSESPIQFITKLDEFQKNLVNRVGSQLEVERLAGKDIGELQKVVDSLNQLPTITNILQSTPGKATKGTTIKLPPTVQKAFEQHPNATWTDPKTKITYNSKGEPI